MLLQEISRWIPRNQRFLFFSLVCSWFCSLLLFLFEGGKLSFVLLFIVTLLTLYPMLLERWSGIANIKGTRDSIVERIEAGATLHLKTRFEVPGFWPITYVFVKDQLYHHHDGLSILESSFVPNYYRRGEIEYTIENIRRGSYYFGETECSTGDIFNLFHHKKKLHLRVRFHVYPKTITIPYWNLSQTKNFVSHSHNWALNKKETTHLDGIREYVEGDRLSQIHWKATAKTGELKSKEFERESLPTVWLVIDRNYLAYTNEEHFELAVSCVASIIKYVRNKGMIIGLLSIGDKATYFEPKRDVSYSYLIDKHLLHIQMDGSIKIHEVLKDPRLKLEQGSIMAIITPKSNEELFNQFKWLKRMNVKPYHFWIQKNRDDISSKHWLRKMKVEGIRVYSIPTLRNLATEIGRD
ncbi:DUF58 domain-containing protein [Evansella cellulosilytica]|uniref:DUF58 domain-containing protein n=1 Tax=Evansella cellulosilytica (strain ATCC 21833 / DSM 2522 / FERM P-1141 / JCM 9156 / N-4) TaxID=649639 RepID=E6TX37_EVAC2|nr:DUF58 domain-containing protein [Evansella cellulosilytica]ADU31126.1 protein of unknown function DUF58 [Evansella cellulosilytica DSM 2522]